MTLLILILEPGIRYQKTIENKPILIFAQDNSASLRFGKDSSYYLSSYYSEIDELLKEFEDDYSIRRLSFGDKVEVATKIDFNEKSTDYSSLFKFVKDNYGNMDQVQLLIASDGLFNSGANPRYLIPDLGIPVHTIQLGDTAKIKDVSVYSIRSNRIGFTNTKLPVRVGFKAQNSKHKKLGFKIKNKNKLILQDEIIVNSENFYQEKDYFIDTDEKGLQRFTAELESNFLEYSFKNNKADFVVDILDSKKKIALFFDQYHPDLGAIRSAFLENPNIDFQLINLSEKQVNFDDLNLVIAYQIPSKGSSHIDLFRQLQYKRIPSLFIVGGSTDLIKLNSLNLGLNINNENAYFQDVLFKGNKNFSLFNLESKKKNSFEKLPPLLAPFGEIHFKSEYNVLAYQRIKNIDTQYPLMAFSIMKDRKMAWIFGEGLWRWKLNEFKQFDTNSGFNDLINRIVQYLALNVKKDHLVVNHQKDFTEGNQIHFKAELYNKSYQLSNKAELNFVLIDAENNTYNYRFSKNEDAYDLSINSLRKGRYKYKVSSIGLEENLERFGEFIVRENNLESKNLQANPLTLKQISALSQGNYYSEISSIKIKDDLLKDNRRKPTIVYQTSYDKAVDSLYLLLFIIILMVSEWFLRRYWLGN
ncbi:hypothetical protein [Marinifilum sp.]|uniref:hypothetical protein n=1 Tax=Marinifilum sp. TaxID=2033137 RepID=UPI003BACCE5C